MDSVHLFQGDQPRQHPDRTPIPTARTRCTPSAAAAALLSTNNSGSSSVVPKSLLSNYPSMMSSTQPLRHEVAASQPLQHEVISLSSRSNTPSPQVLAELPAPFSASSIPESGPHLISSPPFTGVLNSSQFSLSSAQTILSRISPRLGLDLPAVVSNPTPNMPESLLTPTSNPQTLCEPQMDVQVLAPDLSNLLSPPLSAADCFAPAVSAVDGEILPEALSPHGSLISSCSVASIPGQSSDLFATADLSPQSRYFHSGKSLAATSPTLDDVLLTHSNPISASSLDNRPQSTSSGSTSLVDRSIPSGLGQSCDAMSPAVTSCTTPELPLCGMVAVKEDNLLTPGSTVGDLVFTQSELPLLDEVWSTAQTDDGLVSLDLSGMLHQPPGTGLCSDQSTDLLNLIADNTALPVVGGSYDEAELTVLLSQAGRNGSPVGLGTPTAASPLTGTLSNAGCLEYATEYPMEMPASEIGQELTGPAFTGQSRAAGVHDGRLTPHNTTSIVTQPPAVASSSNSLPKSPVQAGHIDCQWEGCAECFATRKELIDHLANSHMPSKQPATAKATMACWWQGCSSYGKERTRMSLRMHLPHHPVDKPSKYKCTHCSKVFLRFDALKSHVATHTGERPYLCTEGNCNKSFSNVSDRLKHIRTHADSRPYVCKMPTCGRRYTDPSSLRKHARKKGHRQADVHTLASAAIVSMLQSVTGEDSRVTDGAAVAITTGGAAHAAPALALAPTPAALAPAAPGAAGGATGSRTALGGDVLPGAA